MSGISHELNPPTRILMGPGPSNIHPRVQMAMTAPLVGHLDPYFVTVMEDIVELLRSLFRTENQLTFPISGTGSAGMEASFCNFLEPGDVVVVGVNGASLFVGGGSILFWGRRQSSAWCIDWLPFLFVHSISTGILSTPAVSCLIR